MSVLFPLYCPATNEQQVLLQHIALHVLKVINDLISAEYTYLHDCALSVNCGVYDINSYVYDWTWSADFIDHFSFFGK